MSLRWGALRYRRCSGSYTLYEDCGLRLRRELVRVSCVLERGGSDDGPRWFPLHVSLRPKDKDCEGVRGGMGVELGGCRRGYVVMPEEEMVLHSVFLHFGYALRSKCRICGGWGPRVVKAGPSLSLRSATQDLTDHITKALREYC